MLDQLFAYDPRAIAPKYRGQIATILRARVEYLRASAEVVELRGRAWAGEEGLTDTIDLKAASLAKLRASYAEELLLPFLQEVVSLDALRGLLPMVALGVLNTFKVPLPVIAESIGIDVDAFMMMSDKIKDIFEEAK